jgi:hypothetical protein
MKRRFSSDELHYLRNNIPIRQLIEHYLGNLSGPDDKYHCPRCHRSDTSINMPHNLLRCFDCSLNFNPIELTMETLGYDFVKAVTWLIKRYPMPTHASSDIISIKQVLPRILSSLPEKKSTMEVSLDHIIDLSTRLSTLEKTVLHISTQLEKILISLPK